MTRTLFDHHEIARVTRETVSRLGRLAEHCGSGALYAADTVEFGRKFNQAPPAHVTLNALRELVGAAEESALPEPHIEAMREAHAGACNLYGRTLPPDGEPHEP